MERLGRRAYPEGERPFDGVVRAAAATSATVALLDEHAARVPTGGDVSGRGDGTTAHLDFEWKAEGSGELMMLALPHHLVELPADVAAEARKSPLAYNTIKGDMLPVVGETWQLSEPLAPLEWGAPRKIDSRRKGAIKAALLKEQAKPMLAIDPYGGGKEIGAIGRLELIAEELGEEAISRDLRVRLAAKLEEWFTGGGKDKLLHERTYGGVVSSMGLADRGADFGGGWYNDHHFHYGYFVYAAAVVAKANSSFVKAWGAHVGHLVRDIANPSADDPIYPRMRFKDWFVGHSWASGLFPSASSRNQESASEAVNAWYAVALYGRAAADERLEALGQLLLATELRAAWTYYQISDDSIYPEPFASNKLVGVLYSTKVEWSRS